MTSRRGLDQDNAAYRMGVADRTTGRPMMTEEQFLAEHPTADADDYPLYVAGYKADRDDLELVATDRGGQRMTMIDSRCFCGCEERATISTADQNDLPDSDFAYIEPGGTKDASGKTVPRSLRHFCITDAAHVRNALGRASQSPFGAKAMPKILAAAKKFGIEASESNALLEGGESRADHAPFDGSHTHAHSAFNSQGGDETHEHEHSHSNDADHDHAHARAAAHPFAERGELHHMPETREMPFVDAEVRMDAVGGGMTFRGYASVFDSPYTIHDTYGEYQETVTRGAFDQTLAQGADVVFLVNHDGAPLGRTKSGTLQIRTDGKGLLTEVRLDPANPRALELKSMVDRQDMDEMSFTFRDLRPTWNDAYTERNLREVSIHHGDVSAVNFGANGATKGLVSMRSQAFQLIDMRAFAELLRELRAGSALSSTSVATLKHVLSLVAAADTAVDEAQPLLADLLGVPNPDVAQDAAMGRALRRLGRDGLAQVKRAIGDACNCCDNHQGSQGAQGSQCDSSCDGTCCTNCVLPDLVNANVSSDSTDDQPSTTATASALAESIDPFEARLRIIRLRGAA